MPRRISKRVKVAVAVAILLIAAVPGWIGYVWLSDRLYQRKAAALLRDIQNLELRKSTWTDACRFRAKWGSDVRTEGACSAAHCDLVVDLDRRNMDHVGFFLAKHNVIIFGPLQRAAGQIARIIAIVRVRDGAVWGKDFHTALIHRKLYIISASARTVRGFEAERCMSDSDRKSEFGRPDGCDICDILWAYVTPYASVEEMRDAFAFDLSCLGDSYRGCADTSQLMPATARRIEEFATRCRRDELSTWTPGRLRTCARDWQNIAVADVIRLSPADKGNRLQKMEYRLIEMLKGSSEATTSLSILDLDREFHCLRPPERVIVFWENHVNRINPRPIFAAMNQVNLQAVRAGVAEAAVDIGDRRSDPLPSLP